MKTSDKYLLMQLQQGKIQRNDLAILLGPVVQSPISANPGLTLNKTYGVNPGLALIGY